MSAGQNRVGKSLVKWLKPIRVAEPHHEEVKPTDTLLLPEDHTKSKPQHSKLAQTIPLRKINESEKLTPPANPASWLDLVQYLLGTCKQAAIKMQDGMGANTYRKVLQRKGTQRIKTLGSIVDVTSDEIDLKLALAESKAKKAA